MSEKPVQLLHQEDTFFRVSGGRLKLRDFGANRGELIWYQRVDQEGPKQSTYSISKTDDVRGLKAVLAAALGLIDVVRKTRELYLVGQTRIHLDQVEGLGDFVELEFVLHGDQSFDEGHTAVVALMKDLGLRHDDLVPHAYIDLIAKTTV
jgi:predicted adenylyl cyclase CyaB